MRAIEIAPSASALLHSLRGLGYSPETALADLIDNSIAARASVVDVEFDWNDGSPRVVVLDDGRGMDECGLAAAMCFGGAGPGADRDDDDLGRFGLGLKTASLSQCRQMTVVARRDSRTAALSWDVDEVERSKRWIALVPESLPQIPLLELLLNRTSGTAVIWDRVDPMGGLFGLDRESFFRRVHDIFVHLAMVFHRFIAGDARRLRISVNGRDVKGWDPFQTAHPATITMQTEPLRYHGSLIRVTPYVLPHRDRFSNDAEYEHAGGPGGWSERQGFYVYRQKRLLVPGGWLGLGGAKAWTQDESSRLARISIDLPPTLDSDWRIDVRKSQARPPGTLRPRLTAIAALCRERAREVFAWRGQRARGQISNSEQLPIWLTLGGATSGRYRINRDHPAIATAVRAANSGGNLVEATLSLVEQSVPIERIWLDVSESGDASAPELAPAEIEALVQDLAMIVRAAPSHCNTSVTVDQLIRYIPGDNAKLRAALLRILETPHEQ
jgi:Histidine kinase-, DNA gyrase B-, and HSP90-like ATPase